MDQQRELSVVALELLTNVVTISLTSQVPLVPHAMCVLHTSRRMALMIRSLVLSPWLAIYSVGWADGWTSVRCEHSIIDKLVRRASFHTDEHVQPGKCVEPSGQVRSDGRDASTSIEAALGK
jgi:hypothetical protein